MLVNQHREENELRGSVLHPDHNAWTIRSELAISYNVIQEDGLFEPANTTLVNLIEAQTASARQLLVIDANVREIYGERIQAYYDHHDVAITMLSIDACETTKSYETAMRIVRAKEEYGTLRRGNPLIAVGGGVLLDIAGFAASVYRRGVPYIRIPTNLMALIDASLGVKTGINVMERRNRLGSYFPPRAAYLDRTFLATTESRHISNGLGEVLKLAVIKDRRLFHLLEEHGENLRARKLQDDLIAPEVIRRSIVGMLDELAPNLWERHLERCVDFGHSFSPMVEMKALPELLHGEAVALDVLFSCYLSAARGAMSAQDVASVKGCMKRLHLPTFHRLFSDTSLLMDALEDTTRHRDGYQRLPLPQGIGDCFFANDITQDEIRSAAARMADTASGV